MQCSGWPEAARPGQISLHGLGHIRPFTADSASGAAHFSGIECMQTGVTTLPEVIA